MLIKYILIVVRFVSVDGQTIVRFYDICKHKDDQIWVSYICRINTWMKSSLKSVHGKAFVKNFPLITKRGGQIGAAKPNI